MPALTVLAAGLPRITRRLPGLRHVPVVRLLAAADLAMVARKHFEHLTPDERRRLARLMRHPRNLSEAEQEELRQLVPKLDPRGFAGSAIVRLSPVRLPRRLTRARY